MDIETINDVVPSYDRRDQTIISKFRESTSPCEKEQDKASVVGDDVLSLRRLTVEIPLPCSLRRGGYAWLVFEIK